MKYYTNKRKIYRVDDVDLYGAIVKVGDAIIVDRAQMAKVLKFPITLTGPDYQVFTDEGDEGFAAFEDAYEFAVPHGRSAEKPIRAEADMAYNILN